MAAKWTCHKMPQFGHLKGNTKPITAPQEEEEGKTKSASAGGAKGGVVTHKVSGGKR